MFQERRCICPRVRPRAALLSPGLLGAHGRRHRDSSAACLGCTAGLRAAPRHFQHCSCRARSSSSGRSPSEEPSLSTEGHGERCGAQGPPWQRWCGPGRGSRRPPSRGGGAGPLGPGVLALGRGSGVAFPRPARAEQGWPRGYQGSGPSGR